MRPRPLPLLFLLPIPFPLSVSWPCSTPLPFNLPWTFPLLNPRSLPLLLVSGNSLSKPHPFPIVFALLAKACHTPHTSTDPSLSGSAIWGVGALRCGFWKKILNKGVWITSANDLAWFWVIFWGIGLILPTCLGLLMPRTKYEPYLH